MTNYYLDQLNKVKPGLTDYAPSIKVFANGNGEDTKHLSLNEESAAVLIDWLKNNYPSCLDKAEARAYNIAIIKDIQLNYDMGLITLNEYNEKISALK